MTSTSAPFDPAVIGARVKHLLLRPKLEWPVIEAEKATLNSLFLPYAVMLSMIGPLAGLIGGQMLPIKIFSVVYRPSIGGSISMAVATWGLGLIAVYLLGLIINALAPNFEGQQNPIQAAKVAVYSMTAFWVAGLFAILPSLSWLGAILGLYSLYLLYVGLPILMKVPQEKALVYTIVVVISGLILGLVVNAIIGNMVSGGILASGEMARIYFD